MFSMPVASLNPCTASLFLCTFPCNNTRAHAIGADEICIGSLGNVFAKYLMVNTQWMKALSN